MNLAKYITEWWKSRRGASGRNKREKVSSKGKRIKSFFPLLQFPSTSVCRATPACSSPSPSHSGATVVRRDAGAAQRSTSEGIRVIWTCLPFLAPWLSTLLCSRVSEKIQGKSFFTSWEKPQNLNRWMQHRWLVWNPPCCFQLCLLLCHTILTHHRSPA